MSDSRRQVISSINKSLRSGTSVTLLGVSGLGKKDFLKDLTGKISEGESIYLPIDTASLVAATKEDFLRSLLYVLIEKLDSLKIDTEIYRATIKETDSFLVYQGLRDALTNLINNTNSKSPIIITIYGLTHLASLEVAFFSSLRALRDVNKERIAYLFVDSLQFEKTFTQQNSGELFDIMANIKVIPYPKGEKLEEIISNCENSFKTELSPEEKKWVADLSGGHSSLIKYAILYISENPNHSFSTQELLEYPAFKRRISNILTDLGDEKTNYLQTYISTNKTDPNMHRFLQKDLIISKKGEVLIPILKELQSDGSNADSGVPLNIKGDTLYVNGEAIEKELSNREFRLIKLFINKPNKIVTREEVAHAIWGSEDQEKYSDWAIDQTISRIRKKLSDNGYQSKYLKTIKGRGYKIIM